MQLVDLGNGSALDRAGTHQVCDAGTPTHIDGQSIELIGVQYDFATVPAIVRSTGFGACYSVAADRALGLVGRGRGRSFRTELLVAFTLASRRAPISASTAGSNAAASDR